MLILQILIAGVLLYALGPFLLAVLPAVLMIIGSLLAVGLALFLVVNGILLAASHPALAIIGVSIVLALIYKSERGEQK